MLGVRTNFVQGKTSTFVQCWRVARVQEWGVDPTSRSTFMIAWFPPIVRIAKTPANTP